MKNAALAAFIGRVNVLQLAYKFITQAAEGSASRIDLERLAVAFV